MFVLGHPALGKTTIRVEFEWNCWLIEIELIRSTEEEKQSQLERLREFKDAA